ncbi:MAG: site-2 protease family protein [Patescibacteria group bacterium]
MEYLLLIIILIFSIVIHEVSHGVIANWLGDPTAKYAGRLTLNPLKHLDLLGSIILPLILIIMANLTGGGFIFGWAKPVPYNPYNLKNKKWGPAMVGIIGPVSNIILALAFGLSVRLLPTASSVYFTNLADVFKAIVWINLLLAVFNLVPIPPLDGSKILFALLPSKYQRLSFEFERYGLILVLFFIFFLFRFIIPIIFWLFKIIVGSSLL